MRQTFVWLVIAVVVLAAVAVQAAPLSSSSPIGVSINGRVQHFASPPIEVNGRVLVPMRDVFQSLGARVSWNGTTQTVMAQNKERINLQVGTRTATVGARQVTLDTAPRMYGNSVYVPLRFVSESLGARVAWNASARRVDIVTTGGPAVAGYRNRPSAPAAKQPTKQVQVVKVDLHEWGVTLTPRQVRAGEVRFEVRNTGTKTHAFALENVSGAVTKDIGKGKTAVLAEVLKPGTYTVFCPIDNHRGLGMHADLTVLQ